MPTAIIIQEPGLGPIARLAEMLAFRPWLSPAPELCPRTGTETTPAARAAHDEKEEVADATAEGPWLLCAVCRHRLTRAGFKIEKNGAHTHTFTNPHGLTFNLRCFSQAPGCAALGPAAMEYSWFAGYAWQIAICGNCRVHLGWKYYGATDTFYGLIREQLVEEEQ